EEVDKTYLKANHLKTGGLLLKPENLQGGVRSLGPVWNSVYVNIYRPRSKGDPDPADTQTIIDLANLISFADDAEFRRRLESLLDVDEFLRFIAMHTLLANLDSYLTTGHNYYLYVNPTSRRVLFLPWDLNLSIGSFVWAGQPSEQIRLSIHKPYLMPNRLIERVLAVDAWKQRYRGYLRLYADTVFAPEKIQSQTALLAGLVEQSRAKWTELGQKPHPAPGLGMWRWGPIPDPADFIPARMKSVRAQLDDAETGYEPFFQLRTILFGPQTRPAR
ncbi:MAG: CotH kinase family protein, partial [Tepidisphaeraceae bacterium]